MGILPYKKFGAGKQLHDIIAESLKIKRALFEYNIKLHPQNCRYDYWRTPILMGVVFDLMILIG